MRTKSFSFTCFFVALLVTVPNLYATSLRGSGKIVSKTINVSPFTGIQLMSSADVEISKGTNFSVVLSDYENLIDSHELTVTDNKLKVGVKHSVSLNNSKANIKITIPGAFYSVYISGSGEVVLSNINTINELAISGSGDIKSSTIDNYSDLELKISGSGDIQLNGKAQNINIQLSGSGDIDLSNLRSQNVDCKLSGSGDIKVYAEKHLKAAITGSGDVSYSGNPQVEKRIIGSGTISHK